MKRRDVVVFGEAIWDLFPRRAGETVSTRRIEVRHPGGAPANVARTLARLGVDVSLVTAVGDDALGDGMIDELHAAGVAIDHVFRLPARTAVTFVEVARDGARRFLFYRHPSADMTLRASLLDPSAFRARFLHFGSSTLARSPSREATRRAIDLAARSGARLSLDLNVRRHLWPSRSALRREMISMMERVDVLKVSEEDAVALGVAPTLAGVRTMHLRRRRDRITFFTLGSRGAFGFWGERVLRTIAPRVRVVDVTGAGDAFVAGSLAVLAPAQLDRLDDAARDVLLYRAARLGCALGARAVTRLGSTAALENLDAFARTMREPLAARRSTPHRSNR